MTVLPYTQYSLEDIERFIECPQFGNSNYGKWGALKLDQRLAIKRLSITFKICRKRISKTLHRNIIWYGSYFRR